MIYRCLEWAYGKIMRHVIKAKALGKETGDLSALANPESVDNIPRIDL